MSSTRRVSFVCILKYIYIGTLCIGAAITYGSPQVVCLELIKLDPSDTAKFESFKIVRVVENSNKLISCVETQKD